MPAIGRLSFCHGGNTDILYHASQINERIYLANSPLACLSWPQLNRCAVPQTASPLQSSANLFVSFSFYTMTPSFSISPGAWSLERKCSIRHMQVHRDEDRNDSSSPSRSQNKQNNLTSSVSLKSLLSGTDATHFDSEDTCSDDDDNNNINNRSASNSSTGTLLHGMTSSSPADPATAVSLQERVVRSIQQQEIKIQEWTTLIQYQQSLVTVRVQSGNDIGKL